MAVKEFYHDLDLANRFQLLGARAQNVTDAAMTALAASLGSDNIGLQVYNTTQGQPFFWNGTEFRPVAFDLAGGVTFAGTVDASAAIEGQTDNVSGFEYVVTVAGTIPASLTFGGDTVTVYGDTNADGTIDLQVGDKLLFVDESGAGADVDGTQSTRADAVRVFQTNVEAATETGAGYIEIATQPETNAGVDDSRAITPAKLFGALAGGGYARKHSETVSIPAASSVNIVHGLNVADLRDVAVSVFSASNSEISVDIDAVDANTIAINSLLPLTGIRVTVIG